MDAGGRRWISVREAAELLGIHPKTAYLMAARGQLPAGRVGKVIRVDRRALEVNLEQQAAGQGGLRGR